MRSNWTRRAKAYRRPIAETDRREGNTLMSDGFQTDSRQLLGRLRGVMAEDAAGQARLDQITRLIAEEMRIEVCSIYLFRDEDTLELCATEGLNAAAVHETRMKLGEGLVGRVARTGQVINTADAPRHARLPLHARDRRRELFVLPGRADPAAWRKAGRAGGAVQGRARASPTKRSMRSKSSRWCWPKWPNWAPSSARARR